MGHEGRAGVEDGGKDGGDDDHYPCSCTVNWVSCNLYTI